MVELVPVYTTQLSELFCQNALLPIEVRAVPRVIFLNLDADWNIARLNAVKEFPSVTSWIEVDSSNSAPESVVTEDKSTVSKFVVDPNAAVSVAVTVLGGVNEVPAFLDGYTNILEIFLLYRTPSIDANEVFATSTLIADKTGI